MLANRRRDSKSSLEVTPRIIVGFDTLQAIAEALNADICKVAKVLDVELEFIRTD